MNGENDETTGAPTEASVEAPAKLGATLLFALALGAIALCGAVLLSAPALAHAGDSGPHNHNGNDTLDIYASRDGQWNGSIRLIIADVNDTPNPGNMPPARRVRTPEEADVIFVRDANASSPGTFTHRSSGVDVIKIRPTVDGGETGERVFIHELGHAYSLQHMTDSECAAAPGGSVMCPRWWNPHRLTAHDEADLRALPNDWRGATNTTEVVR